MELEKIKELLEYRFSVDPIFPKKRHIIFWYDDGGTFKDIVEDLELFDVKILFLEKSIDRKGEEIDVNIFKTKYTLEVYDRDSNYLIYSEYARPKNDCENFLLDIEKYSEYFRADKTAMIVEELSFDRMDNKLIDTIKKYELFFGSKERKEKLSKLLENKENIDDKFLKLGILAALSNSKTLKILDILKNIILDENKIEYIEKWMGLDFLYKEINEKFNIEINSFNKFIKIITIVHFYKSILKKAHINLENYYIGDKNEMFLFVDNLLQDKLTSEIIINKFYEIGKELNIKGRIDELELEEVVQGTSFEYFDKLVIKEIASKLTKDLKEFDIYKNYIDIRLDNSLWKNKYINLYKGLLAALNLLKQRETLEIIERDKTREVFEDYINGYYKVDRYYREFYFAYDNCKELKLSKVLDELEKKISNIYEKEYLEILLSEWSKNIQYSKNLPLQKKFYNNHVKKCDTRVAVIISDALRYEVASEIREKLLKEANTKEIELTGMISELPSITSIGMANLLPHNDEINFNLEDKKVLVRGINSNTTENREKILKLAEKESSAITYDEFKNMYRSKQDEYIKGKKVIYIYHDSIDAIGDKGKTEARTFEACNSAVEDIVSMTKTLSSLGVVNTFITSDHGFLYERSEVLEHDKLELKNIHSIIGKRYALSSEKFEEKGCLTIDLEDKFGVFPIKNQRIKSSGNGLQFVHGGTSPQEMIVPLLKCRAGSNATRARKVKIRLKESLGKLTSNLSKFTIYQLDPVSTLEKIVERDIRVALYTIDGIRVSNEEKIRMNSTEENTLYPVRLTLSGNNEKVILKVIDIESDDILDSKEYSVNLSIASEFDF